MAADKAGRVPLSTGGIDIRAEMTAQPIRHEVAGHAGKASATVGWIGGVVGIILAAAYLIAMTLLPSGESRPSGPQRLFSPTAPAGKPLRWEGAHDGEKSDGSGYSGPRVRLGFGGTPPAYQDAIMLEDLPQAWQGGLVNVSENLREGIQIGLGGDADGMFHFLSSMAAGGEHRAYLPLAICYLAGIGTEPDPVMAVPFLEHQAQQACSRSAEVLSTISLADLEVARQLPTGETERRAIEVRRPRVIKFDGTEPSS